MNATVTAMTIEISCPKCEETIPEPNTGSLFWDVSFEVPNEIQCPNCERTLKVKVPKDTK